MMEYLEGVWQDECDGRPSIDFDTIRKARLDKLLVDMLCRENRPTPTPIQFRADMSTAASLQRQWRTRFRAEYFEMDQKRYMTLIRSGRLKDVVYNGSAEGGCHLWRTTVCKQLSELESDQRFEAGK